MTHRQYAAVTVVALAGMTFATGSAQAGGFYIQEQNAAGVGRAQAGNDVAADDASTIFFNPAGMSFLPGAMVTVGADVIIPHAQLIDNGSTTRSTGAYLVNPAGGGFARPGGSNGGNPGSATPVPDFYLSVPINGTALTAGLGVSAPFGFVSKFTADSFARYDSIESMLQTADIAPTVAWKFSDTFSIGFGLDAQYVHAKLTTALPNALNLGGPSPATDGLLKLAGHTWSTGYNIGLMFQPAPDTKLGLTYRSAIRHDVTGTVTFSGLTGPLAAGNGAVGASTSLDLPDIATAGISHTFSNKLTLLGEIDYYGWSNFQSIQIHLNNGSPDLVTPESYRNTWSAAAGAEYQVTDRFKLRAGMKFDETPTVNAVRDTRVPDGNRVWVSVGFNYLLTDRLGLDAGYSHIFVKDEPINVSRQFYAGAPFPIPTTAQIVAQSQVRLDILSVGLNYRF